MLKLESDVRFFILGIIGALILVYGRLQNTPQSLYIVGSFLLLFVAIHYKLVFYIALELILASEHSALLLGIGPYTQIALPLLLCIQLLIVYVVIGKENNLYLITGIIGIALLSWGFAYNNQLIFLSGSSGISIYSYYTALNGKKAAYIWAVLNSVFVVIALYRLIF